MDGGEPESLGKKAREAIGGGKEADVNLLPITARHADQVATMPMHHQDPFDRFLVAQAEIDTLTLVSADAAMGLYDVEILW